MPLLLVAILASLLILIPSVNLVAYSNQHQETLIQNSGNILVQSNFGGSILFEHGAETGSLVPPWDHVGDEAVWSIVSSPVRSGSKAVRFDVPNPATNQKHSKTLEWTDYEVNEAYYSAWFYVPSGRVVNEWVLIFQGKDNNPSGPPGDEHRGIWGLFILHSDSNPAGNFNFQLADFAQKDGRLKDAVLDTVQTNHWYHAQIYIKTSSGFRVMDGTIKLWIDEVLKVDWTNVGTRGEGPESAYMWGIGNYVGGNEPPNTWLAFDDVVMAQEKIPSSYSVLNQ